MTNEEHLLDVFGNLIKLKNECSCEIFSECGLSDLTVKQIRYLKMIDENGEITFSRLAEITRNSKPTITGMIDKFVRMECVYREKSSEDGRILYIRLTDKGRMIAQAEQKALCRVVDRILASLDAEDLDELISILKKVG